MPVYRDFQFPNDLIACLHNIFLEVESVKVYHFQEQERSVEAVPRHKNRVKDNLSCLNKKPVQYGNWYPVWFFGTGRKQTGILCTGISSRRELISPVSFFYYYFIEKIYRKSCQPELRK